MSANDVSLHYDVIFENECIETALSIIIPVLNAEKYVKKFVEHIKSERLISSNNSVEFIFIDGGSQDKTLNLILKYVNEEELCGKVVYAENADVSTSRNIGLELSKGEYVAFADIDDIPILHGFIVLLNLARMYRVDLAFGKLIIFDEIKNRVVYETPFKELIRISSNDLLSQILLSYCRSHHKSLDLRFQQGLYRRRFLLHENIRFISGTISHEDFEFLIKALMKVDEVLITPIPVYIYFAGPTSIRLKRFFNGLKTLERVCKLVGDAIWCRMMLLQDISALLDHYLHSKMLKFKLEKELQQFTQLNYDILLTHYYMYLQHLIRFCLRGGCADIYSIPKIFKTLLKYALLRILQT